jgi:hypothetical protein
MSQIAEFYVVPDAAIAEIERAAVPQKTKWYRPPEDTFWPTLWARAGNGVLNFEWSGYAFVVLIEYLREGRSDFGVEACEQSELASRLSEARTSYFLTFTPAQAQEWAQKLAAIPAGDAGVAQYVMEFCHEDERDTMLEAVRNAITIFPDALRQVQAGTTGLLSVG